MNQDFKGGQHFVSNGRKVIFWTKNPDGQWYILREVFDNKRFSIPNFSENDVLTLNGNDRSHAVNTHAQTTSALKR